MIKNSLAETSCLGPEFAGILSVEQSFSQLIPVITTDVPVRSFNSSLTIHALLVQEIIRTSLIFHCTCIFSYSGIVIQITAYRKLNQVSGLRVRSMPRGSTSTLADLGQRLEEHQRLILSLAMSLLQKASYH